MDWFERLTGFPETTYDETRSRLEVEGATLRSRVNGRSYGIGELTLPSLAELRDRAAVVPARGPRLTFRNIRGDVRALHREAEYVGALFQGASQFNLLEMVGPHATPEDGVGGYQYDATQGPACAIAAGAATIYRNYFAPVEGGAGQTEARQIDVLADMARAFGQALDRDPAQLWSMTNGYALASPSQLDVLRVWLEAENEEALDAHRGRLRIGLHSNVEVTDVATHPGPTVSQAFCSALPVAYSGVDARTWQPFAKLVLSAAYEATLWASVLNAREGGSRIVLLTRLGGGAFGNEDVWIDWAIRRALTLAAGYDLDVRLVNYGATPWSMEKLEAEWAAGETPLYDT